MVKRKILNRENVVRTYEVSKKRRKTHNVKFGKLEKTKK